VAAVVHLIALAFVSPSLRGTVSCARRCELTLMKDEQPASMPGTPSFEQFEKMMQQDVSEAVVFGFSHRTSRKSSKLAPHHFNMWISQYLWPIKIGESHKPRRTRSQLIPAVISVTESPLQRMRC